VVFFFLICLAHSQFFGYFEKVILIASVISEAKDHFLALYFENMMKVYNACFKLKRLEVKFAFFKVPSSSRARHHNPLT